MKKKVLITGISGFVGKHLTEYLLSKNDSEIFGTYRSESGLSKLDKHKNSIRLEKVDLLIQEQAASYIESVKPQQIYHLAGLPSAAESFNTPGQSITNNILAELSVLEALKKNAMTNTRVLAVSTAEVYGMVRPEELPIGEKTELRPINPYAVSKIAQDYLGLQYHLSYGMDIIRARPFNHIGPYQKDNFAVPAFAKQIAQIEKGQQESVLRVGNLTAKRDFTDVRDIVRVYTALMEMGKTGEVYNIGSGKSHSTEDLLSLLLSFTQEKITVKEDPSRMRPIEVADIYCDNTKINSVTGWKPEIPLEKTLRDTLDYWRGMV